MSSPTYARNPRRKSRVHALSGLFHGTTGRHEGGQGHGRRSQGQTVWVTSPNPEQLWPPSDTHPQRLVTPTSSAETCLLIHWRECQPSHMFSQPTNRQPTQKPPPCPQAPQPQHGSGFVLTIESWGAPEGSTSPQSSSPSPRPLPKSKRKPRGGSSHGGVGATREPLPLRAPFVPTRTVVGPRAPETSVRRSTEPPRGGCTRAQW